jgi:hypothetical protein
VVIAIGLYIYLSAPKGSLVWLVLAVGVALIGQQLGGLFLSPTHSGAVGAFLVVPFAMLGARVKTSPPAIVMMLAAFWALVPGALSFQELGRAAAGGGERHRDARYNCRRDLLDRPRHSDRLERLRDDPVVARTAGRPCRRRRITRHAGCSSCQARSERFGVMAR